MSGDLLRVLIDTNVFIHSESNKVIQTNVAKFVSLAMKHGIVLMVHPASLEDIRRDSNELRRKVQESKFGKYPILGDTAEPDDSFIDAIGGVSRPQDKVDNKILFSIYKNAANFLVTEDLGIHRKARKLGLGDRVLAVSQALEYMRRQFERYVPEHILLEHLAIHTLDFQLKFFDSLREDYPEFDDWFIEKSREGRMCWCWKEKKRLLKALLIYTEKNKSIFGDSNEKVLKICTFKVSEEARGLKVGELLLKICFDYCSRNRISAAYLTTFPKKIYLRVLLEDFGFDIIGKNLMGELIYAKDFLAPQSLKDMNPLEYCKSYFPKFYDGELVRKFVVPIRPEYHDRLFADVKGRQTFIDEFVDMVIEQNTIKKAYVCNSRITKIRSGDILLFYRSRKKQGITGIGVVESVLRQPASIDELIAFIGPRSVYSKDELDQLHKRGALAILFRYIGQLPSHVNRDKLLELGALSKPPQSIVTMDNISYNRLKESALEWLI